MAKGRILIGKPGLDGHDRGAKYIVRLLRNAGYDVTYTGIRRSPEQIVDAAIEHNVDAIGLSVMSGAHKVLFQRVLDLLKEKGRESHLGIRRRTDSSRRFAFSARDRRQGDLHRGRSAESILTAIDRMLGERARQTVN